MYLTNKHELSFMLRHVEHKKLQKRNNKLKRFIKILSYNKGTFSLGPCQISPKKRLGFKQILFASVLK